MPLTLFPIAPTSTTICLGPINNGGAPEHEFHLRRDKFEISITRHVLGRQGQQGYEPYPPVPRHALCLMNASNPNEWIIPAEFVARHGARLKWSYGEVRIIPHWIARKAGTDIKEYLQEVAVNSVLVGDEGTILQTHDVIQFGTAGSSDSPWARWRVTHLYQHDHRIRGDCGLWALLLCAAFWLLTPFSLMRLYEWFKEVATLYEQPLPVEDILWQSFLRRLR
ncbi:hypothetical protein W97_08931 [Coniosporium apollinis CBS 100218]|uniref:Uncharacterized protein n=1 Tax=Coniosporium apollinis (strain CBS 100218) TaxID=1168221 RepID=R7Z6P8_CONA1|nr:uncharacterized protein W97_08931 [Coniosporium apollinis CBS 100218]EON69679.1 hypothetical protein W97_08931 [Coniosporium apollinis CBS 100218]